MLRNYQIPSHPNVLTVRPLKQNRWTVIMASIMKDYVLVNIETNSGLAVVYDVLSAAVIITWVSAALRI